MRRGEPDAHATLLEAMQLAERTEELHADRPRRVGADRGGLAPR